MYMFKLLVGAPRIELGLSAPKADVLPVYYAPCVLRSLGAEGYATYSTSCPLDILKDNIFHQLHVCLFSRKIEIYADQVYLPQPRVRHLMIHQVCLDSSIKAF